MRFVVIFFKYFGEEKILIWQGRFLNWSAILAFGRRLLPRLHGGQPYKAIFLSERSMGASGTGKVWIFSGLDESLNYRQRG